jgi:hypothetical protein
VENDQLGQTSDTKDEHTETEYMDAVVGSTSQDGNTPPSLELIEVIPGTAVVFGDVPEELDLLSFGLVPERDRELLSSVLGIIGNAGTIGGNLANAITAAQGLYRLDGPTQALIDSGARLAMKDGAKLGSIFKDGHLVAQARFVPVSMTASAIAAIGPAVAMVALQMQLNKISGLVESNIALTKQTLGLINQEQWAELAGLSASIDRAIDQAEQVGSLTTSIWENIAGNEPKVDKQLDLYRRKVSDHIRQLHQAQGVARRDYLQTSAEAIFFDSTALLYALKAQAGYQAMRAAHARNVGQRDENEARLAEVIEQGMHDDLDAGIQAVRELVVSLIRELRIVAELPGRAALPLTKSRSVKKASQLSCQKLLDALEPLADTLHVKSPALGVPTVICAPDKVNLDAYLRILRWFMHDGEELTGMAFAYQPGAHDFAGMVPQVLEKRVDAVWDSLDSGALASVIDKTTSTVLIAVTSMRIILAAPRAFLTRGEIKRSIPRSDIRFVRSPKGIDQEVRPTIEIITENEDFRLMFPKEVSGQVIDGVMGLVGSDADDGAMPADEREVATGESHEELGE